MVKTLQQEKKVRYNSLRFCIKGNSNCKIDSNCKIKINGNTK